MRIKIIRPFGYGSGWNNLFYGRDNFDSNVRINSPHSGEIFWSGRKVWLSELTKVLSYYDYYCYGKGETVMSWDDKRLMQLLLQRLKKSPQKPTVIFFTGNVVCKPARVYLILTTPVQKPWIFCLKEPENQLRPRKVNFSHPFLLWKFRICKIFEVSNWFIFNIFLKISF